MRCWKIKILPVLLLPLLLSEPAHGGQNEIENQDVPVIVTWQEGHGFGEDGRMIYSGWAFDPESGCYVRFDNGNVLVKALYRKCPCGGRKCGYSWRKNMQPECGKRILL